MTLTPNETALLLWVCGITLTALVALIIYLANGVLNEQKAISKNVGRLLGKTALTDKVVEGLIKDMDEAKDDIKDMDNRVFDVEKKLAAIRS